MKIKNILKSPLLFIIIFGEKSEKMRSFSKGLKDLKKSQENFSSYYFFNIIGLLKMNLSFQLL